MRWWSLSMMFGAMSIKEEWSSWVLADLGSSGGSNSRDHRWIPGPVCKNHVVTWWEDWKWKADALRDGHWVVEDQVKPASSQCRWQIPRNNSGVAAGRFFLLQFVDYIIFHTRLGPHSLGRAYSEKQDTVLRTPLGRRKHLSPMRQIVFLSKYCVICEMSEVTFEYAKWTP